MKIKTKLRNMGVVGGVAITSSYAQETTGVPGSASASRTIDGRYLPLPTSTVTESVQ